MTHARPLSLLLAAMVGGTLAGTARPQAVDEAGRAAAQSSLRAPRAEVDTARRPVDPTFVRSRADECERNPGKANCKVVLRRMTARPVLGVVLQPDAAAGVRIVAVTPDSAAALAGLRSGDRLRSVGGAQVTGDAPDARLEHARTLLAKLDAGTPVRIGYTRDGNAATVDVQPRVDKRVAIWSPSSGTLSRFGGDVQIQQRADGALDVTADRIDTETVAGVPPMLRREVVMLGDPCEGGSCSTPVLMQALRWNGLNLASVDAQLGRYFGTDRGVLVLSAGELDGLQPGDVIQRVDGTAVGTPREVMDALRDKPGDARVPVAYLRDRKPATTQVKVPRLGALPFPPAPPAPPSPPDAPAAPRAPPAPPAPPRPTSLRDMQAPAPVPPPLPSLPPLQHLPPAPPAPSAHALLVV